MEKHLKQDEASQLDKVLSLIRKVFIANKNSITIETDVDCINGGSYDFRVYQKLGKSDIIMWQSIKTGSYNFDDQFNILNYVFNKLVNTGMMPETYPEYSSKKSAQ